MSDDRRKVLDMLAEGKISAAEADKLLAKIHEPVMEEKTENKKFLHIKVNDGENTNVDINLPLVLAETGLKLIPKDQLKIIEEKGINIDDILELVREGTKDSIMNVNTVNEGKEVTVQVYID